jgi:hypothetical protein
MRLIRTAILSKTRLPERDREHLTQTWQIERLRGCQLDQASAVGIHNPALAERLKRKAAA